jgi:3-hydroxybutyryl-CoA dehydrogenase
MSSERASNRAMSVAVVGLGYLGRGIATCLLGHGFRVIGWERTKESHAAARSFIELGLREMVTHSAARDDMAATWRDRYVETTAYDNWGACDFVIESVVEDLATKREVFDEAEAVVRADVPIASNTSAIPISELQRGRRNPERFVGMHWFEPAHATRFLELVPGELTSAATMEATRELARRCEKEPSVLKKDAPGLLINRIGYAIYREALNILESGIADAETIDRSFRNALGVWSTVCGPFQWIDLTGGPGLYAECMRRVLPTLANTAQLPEPIRALSESGAQGVTNGRGFYEYTPEEAERAEELFREHAWRARAIQNEYFPLKED